MHLALKTLQWRAAAALALLLPVAALAQERLRVFGGRYWHPKAAGEFVRTYVDMPKDHDGDTVPLAVGFQLTPGFIREAEELPVSWSYNSTIAKTEAFFPGAGTVEQEQVEFPIKAFENFNLKFPAVGRNPFTFAGFTYQFNGHPPIGVYDFQHFDVRFFMVDPDWWFNDVYSLSHSPGLGEGACGNPYTAKALYDANLPIPLDCWPGDVYAHQNVGHYLWGAGMHIYDLTEPGWQTWVQGSSIDDVDSFTWGMSNGEIVFVESMFSRSRALTPDINECIDITDQVPKHFNTERWVPTRKCIIRGPITIKLEYSNFIRVPGGCLEMRNATNTMLVGWMPQTMIPTYHNELTGAVCKFPQPDQ